MNSAQFLISNDVRELVQPSERGFNWFKHGNYSLAFWKIAPHNKQLKACGRSQKAEDKVDYWADASKSNFADKGHYLDRVQRRLACFAASPKESWIWTTTQVSPLTIGMGYQHPTENGFSLDRNTGLPVIPGSSFKGAVRYAYLHCLAKEFNITTQLDESDDKYGIQQVFGFTEKKKGSPGAFVFLESHPVKIDRLECDILNPHYPDYYRDKGGTAPTDDQNPVPINFLRTPIGTQWVFRVVPTNPGCQKELNQTHRLRLKRAIELALTTLGLGGKTSLGYGRFSIAEGEPPSIAQDLNREEIERAQAEEQARLENMPEVDRTIHELETKGPSGYLENFDELLSSSEGDDLIKLARYFKKRLQQDKRWNVKPKKTKPYAKVQKIKQILGES